MGDTLHGKEEGGEWMSRWRMKGRVDGEDTLPCTGRETNGCRHSTVFPTTTQMVQFEHSWYGVKGQVLEAASMPLADTLHYWKRELRHRNA
ncbi:hypothetical protein RRG08_035492 [Elysia crispata]|uniref:Uncharacterized protein n=1 Tax=Elysia crispata TaxID=231223 RepID=A0AAE1AQJ6_9GAST|nr:hypothetical protein RRG08_035492 [Elysia crispata]